MPNYFKVIKQYLGDLEQVEHKIGDLTKKLLAIKTTVPSNKFGEINSALAGLAQATKNMDVARKGLEKAITVTVESRQPLEEYGGPGSTDSSTRMFENPRYDIRQTEVWPVERYEVKVEGTKYPSLVSRHAENGDWKCYSCKENSGPDKHVEVVKHWLYKGRPAYVDNMPSPADSLASPNGYEGQGGRMATDRPVGIPEEYDINAAFSKLVGED